jgi:hypothetical protein
MRERKNNITLDVDSALALMQEVYNDVVENRNQASIIMKKMLAFMKDAADMTLIGPVIKDQQKIMNDCVEKKLSLVKLQSVLLKQTGGDKTAAIANSGGFRVMSLSDEDRKMLDDLIEDQNKNKSADDESYEA